MSYTNRFRNRRRNSSSQELQLFNVYKNKYSNRNKSLIIRRNDDSFHDSLEYDIYQDNNRTALIISRIIVVFSVICFVCYIYYNRYVYKLLETYTCTLGSEPLSTLSCAIPYSLNLITYKAVVTIIEVINKAILTNNIESIAASCAFVFAIYKSCTAFFYLIIKNYEKCVHSFVLYVMGLH